MKCEVAKDLIMLYAEDLCSSETAEELKAHLETCSECAKRLEVYKKELITKIESDEADNESLKPMKKIKKKLVRGKIKVAILCVILAVMFGGLGVLSYGQFTNECLSFSVIADMIKIKSVCKSLAKGDTEPFVDVIAYRIEDKYTVRGAKELEDFEAYITQVEKDVKYAYEYYFAGKDVKVKIDGIEQIPYKEEEATDTPDVNIMIGFYEKNELLYELAFGKVSQDKFIVYEVPQNGEPAFTTSILPFCETSLDICLHYATKAAYENVLENNNNGVGAGFSIIITKEGTEEEQDLYRDQFMEKIRALNDEGWHYKEVMYFVDEYDNNAGKWIYKVWFMLENQSSKEIVMIEQKFHYYKEDLYVIEDRPAIVIGTQGNLSQSDTEPLLGVFN